MGYYIFEDFHEILLNADLDTSVAIIIIFIKF